MSSDFSVVAQNLGKRYDIFERPSDRLKQMLFGKRRSYGREFWALRNISFEVARGSSVGIVGVNGSGKSTLLQLICGTLQPTEGVFSANGRISALLELGSGFDPDFTGHDNVYLNGAILGLSRAEIDERYNDIVEFSGIRDFMHQKVSSYSSGMQVRLAFSVAVHTDPELLVVDEALAVGDNLFQKRCYERIEAMRARGVTLLFVSHDQETIRTLTEKSLLLDHGKQLMWGPSSEVILEYRKLLHEKETASLRETVTHAMAASQVQMAAPVPQDTQIGTTEAVPENSRSQGYDFGDGDAQVLSVVLLDAQGEAVTVLEPNQPMIIRMTVAFSRDLTHLNAGIRIRNKQGVKIYSWGTLNQDITNWARQMTDDIFWSRTFHAGETLVLDLRCSCPLGFGFYEIQSYITEEKDRYFGSQRILSWNDEACFFSVTMAMREYFFGGLCDMRMHANVVSIDQAVATTEPS
ncbi:MAG: ABC transporter ATP-binding protein [Acetobacter okinawensis]|uniref:ABC transporter ATP-binding protein n=1 Tax=Acetobacter okinawensis TaxID=1076594 RepID=UPI0039E9AFCE